jgi:pimeloyl-ACP methyl ester carboxylesterase
VNAIETAIDLATPDGTDPLTEPERRALRAPAIATQFLEQRVLFEVGALAAAAPWLRAIGRGDRHPVLVLPGFMGDDASTVALRAFIRSWGYWAHGWGLGSNLGPTPQTLGGVRERLETLHSRHGRQVSLVGWSAGGVFARHLARTSPGLVRQVVTLGSPLQMRPGDRAAPSRITDVLQSRFDPTFGGIEDYRLGPLPVPSTSVYSRTDGVVRWQVCLDVADDRHDNVEVRASHVGLGFNPAAVYVVGDRLGQAEGTWRPFRAPAMLARLYPPASSWDAESHHHHHHHGGSRRSTRHGVS